MMPHAATLRRAGSVYSAGTQVQSWVLGEDPRKMAVLQYYFFGKSHEAEEYQWALIHGV